MVKHATGWFIQDLAATAAGGDDRRPQHVRIHDRLVQAIRSGELPPRSRLPSSRQLAADWGVSRNTVDDALSALQAEGWIERRVGRGSHVAARLPSPPPTPERARREPSAAAQRALQRLRPISDDPADRPLHGQQGYALRPQLTDVSRFPLATWRRLVAGALADRQRHRLDYGAAAGTPELRAAVVRHLALTRGVRCSARQVIVVESVLQGFGLIAQVLFQPGDTLCLCEPGHISTPRFFSLLNLEVHGIAPDADGFDVDAARAVCPRPTAVLVQPHTQYPLGARMPPARRAELLRWADDCGAWVIEHEFLGELALDGPSPPPLLAQDRGEGVLLAGSFSPVMYPSLRLAYLVVPERLAPAFAAVRGMLGDHSPVPMQLALARFIDEGHLAAQLRGLRELYLRRRAALVDTLRPGLARLPGLGARLHVPPAGVNVCLELPPSHPDAALLPALAARCVAPGALSLQGREAGTLNGLVLGFGGDTEPQIVAAAEAVMQVLAGA